MWQVLKSRRLAGFLYSALLLSQPEEVRTDEFGNNSQQASCSLQ